ncbi:YbcC family protein [Parvularcula lutaonensis]|uniref:Probable inorganic carbon transporter subunit DabA n=1 Tax=Parvularcula lutaonensis TaxID=491923 RepID=A0ABV7M6V4_9PROT|nr:DUF2309 domain-containing protein [Parvularcula lutaonensis]GGY56815.1 UPF0753 protein [Parvularcula lutaonensis]
MTIVDFADPGVLASDKELRQAALSACELIAPIWPLKDFVAVNPMQGMSSTAFSKANRAVRRANGQSLLMPRSYYRDAFAEGVFTLDDIEAAIGELGMSGRISPEEAVGELSKERAERDDRVLPSFADLISDLSGQDWASFVVDQISFWAAGYFDQGQALWRYPWADRTPYAAWRAQASIDRSPELLGLHGFRAEVAILPSEPLATLKLVVTILNIPEESRAAYFHRLLSTVAGWAGHMRYRGWGDELKGGKPDQLMDLLAIRAAFDLCLFNCLRAKEPDVEWAQSISEAYSEKADERTEEVDLLAHRALERAYQRRLVRDLHGASRIASLKPQKERPSAQAVFCIDVRSERFRRALEAADPTIETLGFAGFFGLPLAVEDPVSGEVQAQCPVLLEPRYTVEVVEGGNAALLQLRRSALGAWKHFKNAAVASFSFVEAMGVGFASALARDSILLPSDRKRKPASLSVDPYGVDPVHGIPLDDRIALAEAMISGMALGPDPARIVLLAGHGATVTNNPYAAGLDCGACGGHAGDSNARVAAAVLNDARVRRALADRDRGLPEDTVFVAALHDTVTDDVTILDLDAVPESHAQDLAMLRRNLVDAGRMTRRERAAELGLPVGKDTDRMMAARSRDWSQIRPEWGLAGCAAFIAAPRKRSRGIDLEGRAFLHSYEWRTDTDNSVLELIMTAPLVVASWINLQYYASTVNNEAFGSGDKTLHNVVGGVGVLEGNAGDLRGGLPLQSVHTGTAFYHQPLRLTAVIEAPIARIDAVLAKHQHVADLFDNQWLTLIAIEDEGWSFRRYVGHGSWSDASPLAEAGTERDAA